MKIFILFFAFSLIIEGCSSSKLILNQTGSSNEAIENAILDFLNTNKNNKKDSVFSVKFYDTLYRMVLEKVDSINSRWVNGEPYNNIVGVSILEASNRKFLLTKDAIIGSKGKLPSRIFKKNGKFFIGGTAIMH